MTKIQTLAALLLLPYVLGGCSSIPSWMGGAKKEIIRAPGERITVLPSGEMMNTDDSYKHLSVSLPSVFPNPEWPQHTGVFIAATGNLGATGTFESETQAEAGGGEEFEHTLIPRPVVAAGMVFVMDAVGNISAHDAGDINAIRWQSPGVSEEDAPDIIGGGLAYDQGKLYAVSGRGVVAAFDASTGRTIWTKALRTPIRSAPKVAGGRLFAVTIDSQVFALNIANGDVIWDQRGISETAGMMNSVSPTVEGDAVIVPYSSGELYALSTIDGKEIWNNSLSLSTRTQASSVFAGIGGDPVVDGQVLFAVSSSGMLSVLSLSQGQILWERPISSINTPWVAGDYMFLLTTDNTLVAFIKYSGSILWKTKFASFEDEERRLKPITWRGPVLVNGNLAIVSSHGELKLVSAADGTVTATHEISEGIYTPPVVAGGKMYLVSKDATLHSLQ